MCDLPSIFLVSHMQQISSFLPLVYHCKVASW